MSEAQRATFVGPYDTCRAKHDCYEPAKYQVRPPFERSTMLACSEHLERAINTIIAMPPFGQKAVDLAREVHVAAYFQEYETREVKVAS